MDYLQKRRPGDGLQAFFPFGEVSED